MTVEPTKPASQTADPATSDPAATASEPAVESPFPVIIDDRTVIVPAGLDLFSSHQAGSVTSEPPTADEVSRVLAQIDSAPDLAWAQSHTRAVYSIVDEGTRQIEVGFACGLDPVATPEAAYAAAQEALNPPLGGGDCYGRAVFGPEGELVSWRTNGES